MKVSNTFAFSPILVFEDQIYNDVYTHELRNLRPRCEIGEVALEHIVAIIVDTTDKTTGISLA